jgi:cell division protease FtsH
MVCKWGMSARLGLVTYAEEGAPPTGYDKAAMSDSTTTLINDEVRLILERSYARAKTVLTERSHSLHALAVALLEYETLDADAIRAIVDMPPPPRSNPAGTRPFAP